MEHDLLEKKKTVIEERFNELVSNKTQIEEELHRLQGEHRLITELMSSDLRPPKRLKKVSDEDATN